MSQYNGSTGWIALAVEAVEYGTAGTPLVYQHGLGCSLRLVEGRVKSPVLGSNAPDIGRRLNSYVEGGIELGLAASEAILGPLYRTMASEAGTIYSFTGTPAADSITAFVDYGGTEYDYTGLVTRSLTWQLNGAGEYSTVSADFIGRAMTKYDGSARTTDIPAASGLTIPSGLTTFTVGGTDVASLKSATITVQRSVSGIERQRLGSAVLPQPIIGADRPVISATFNLELDADGANDNDTIALLDDYLAGTSTGTIALGNFQMSGTQPVGEVPNLARGFVEFTLNVEATGMTITMSG